MTRFDSSDPQAATDHDLVDRFKRGDEQAFVQLMVRHERRVYNLAYRMLGRAEDARDATQDAFLSCYRSLRRFRGDAAFSTWLHRVAVNACYDLLRRRTPATSLDDALVEPAPAPDHADRAATAADVQQALLAVPSDFRTVLILFEVQDMSLEEISATLEVPVGTVKSRLHRGRVALGRALGSPGGRASSFVEGTDETAARPAERATPARSQSGGEPAAPAAPSNPPNP
jgi:RNA polymerase sigma-70 factor (ECF subfamily)